MNFEPLENEPRLLITAKLKPLQGSRFQPTGFPDLGAAEYALPDGKRGLLVESAQSMANRLEAVCWNEARGDLVAPLAGLPYVVANLPKNDTTNSILEAHRINSPFIANSDEFDSEIRAAIGFEKDQPFDRRKLAQALLRYDPNSLIHGIFLEKVGGVVRLPRTLSAFIEAKDVSVAASGGVKIDRVQPATGESTPYGKANEGYGNVPYQRDEYVAADIHAYFNLDLALLRSLGLPEAAIQCLIGLALFKVQTFLASGLRLRTACDLEVHKVKIKRPDGYELPTADELAEAMPTLIKACQSEFRDPPVLEVNYRTKSSKKSK